jgi:hypothetical protein
MATTIEDVYGYCTTWHRAMNYQKHPMVVSVNPVVPTAERLERAKATTWTNKGLWKYLSRRRVVFERDSSLRRFSAWTCCYDTKTNTHHKQNWNVQDQKETGNSDSFVYWYHVVLKRSTSTLMMMAPLRGVPAGTFQILQTLKTGI